MFQNNWFLRIFLATFLFYCFRNVTKVAYKQRVEEEEEEEEEEGRNETIVAAAFLTTVP
jgi:hypothetical protein